MQFIAFTLVFHEVISVIVQMKGIIGVKDTGVKYKIVFLSICTHSAVLGNNFYQSVPKILKNVIRLNTLFASTPFFSSPN